MQANILFDGVPVRGPLPEAEIPAVSSDSGRVTPGGLFICLPGTRHDGHDFAAEALAGGAGWILAEHPVRDVPPGRTILTE